MDATTEITASVTLNEVHLVFLLLARLRWHLAGASEIRLGDVLHLDQARVFEGPVKDLSLRQLLDTVQNFQAVWREIIAGEDPVDVYRALDACM
eukprot:1905332-Rhodomonas_salina.1